VLRAHDLGRSADVSLLAAAFEGSAIWRDGPRTWVLVEPGEASAALDPLGGAAPPVPPPAEALRGREAELIGEAPLWLGLLPYEAFRPSLERAAWSKEERRPAPLLECHVWRRYEAAFAIAPGEPTWLVADEVAIGALSQVALAAGALAAEPAADAPPRALAISVAEPPEAHRARVRDVLRRIRDGELYQVNLARRFELAYDVRAPVDWISLYAALCREFPARFSFLVPFDEGVVVGASPELALSAEPTPDCTAFASVLTSPIKGTRARGRTPTEDAARRLELERDEKEIAELSMIVDVERNDVHRIARRGTVSASPFRTEALRTVFHRVADVEGLVAPGTSRRQVLAALLPCGSVTGAPKVRAMEVAATLEAARRGLYTGAVGVLTRSGRLRLAMAIRTMVFDRDGAGDYWVGGGIVADSDPDRELEETLWKSEQLFRLVERTRGSTP
jgi:anthranilate/para-aminobenzoate synthase component I